MTGHKYPKPHATFKEHGVTYVKHMVAPEVKTLLVLMQLYPGSFMLKKAGSPGATLRLPGQPPMTITPDKEAVIIDWLKKDDIAVDGVFKYVLEEDTMDYIRGMERRGS